MRAVLDTPVPTSLAIYEEFIGGVDKRCESFVVRLPNKDADITNEKATLLRGCSWLVASRCGRMKLLSRQGVARLVRTWPKPPFSLTKLQVRVAVLARKVSWSWYLVNNRKKTKLRDKTTLCHSD